MKRSMRSFGLAMLVLTAVMSAACGARTINKVLADPGHYRNKSVKLTGAVVDSYSVVGRGAYQLDDNTGRLWIVSDNGVPRKGARVQVTGTVREGFSLGSLGDRLKLPTAVGAGIVLVEESHKAK
jgi:membrane protein implicated in regulation of membrane protease activity